MKEFSLSLLSRGCGRLISSKRNPGRHDGRLDVCFTPQDYYIWKSQEPLLHLSNSGRLLVKAESTLPKTYSTRRGPLLLYSQDLVSTESKCGSVVGNRKKRVVQHYSQQVEQQLSTLKELTSAILSYSNNQCSYSRLAPSIFPPLHVPPVPNVRFPNCQPAFSTPAQPSPELFVQHNPVWLPAEENTEQLENQPEDKEELNNRSRVRLDVFLQITCTSRSPTPQTEPQPWVHYVALTPEEPEEDKAYSDMCLQQTESSQYTEINHHSTGEELPYPHMNCVYDMADDRDCSIWRNSETLSDKGNCERSMSGSRHRRTGLYLPPVELGISACYRSCGEKMDWLDGAEHHAQRLPPIAGATAQVIHAQNQQDVRPQSKKDTFLSRENLNRLRLPPLVLSPLFPEQEEEMSVKQKGEREKTGRSYFKKQTAAGGRRGRLPSEKGATILLEPGHEPPPAVGVSGCVVGRIGPGRQSSLAFLQNRLPDLQNPCGSIDADRGVVRGLLPLELRDLQNGKSVGSLILGPDGEIIQLSLYDNNSQHPSQVDNGTQQQALQVLSTEGETLPWIIVLQSDETHRDGAVELNTDALISNVQQHLPKHKGTESHVSVGQFATGERRLRTKPFQDVHGSTETNTCPATSRPDTVAVILKKTKSAEAGTETLTKPKKDGRNNVRITPLREEVGTEEQRGGNAEAEVEEEDEKRQTGHSSPSHRPGQSRKKHHDKEDMFGSEQNISPTDATTEEAVDRSRRNIKKKDTEEAALTTGTSGITTAESKGQKTSRISRDGGWQRQKTEDTSQPIRSQKPEERTNRGTTETHDVSAPSSLKKQTRDEREGKRRQVKKNEGHERGGGAAARQKDVSTGKKRGRLTHKELVVESNDDPVEKEEVEINQELEEEESFLKSPESPSATQKHKTEAKKCEDVETDCLSSNDEHRNIRSVSSLRSSDAASHLHQRNSRGSAASSWGGAMIASATGFSSACGRLSSCSTVMVADEQLMLNPVKPEFPRMSQEETAALRLAQRAERRRQEVERKRREREEEERRQQEREQTEERMKSELEGERRKRAEELRLKKLAEEEQRRRHEEEEQARVRREQAKREMERRSQEERRRQMERLQRMREEEERRRKAELERLQMEEQRRQEEENRKLQEMDESERIEYLHVKEQEEEERREKEEENKRREEEAALWGAEQARLQAEQLAREVALLHHQLAFKRGLVLEAGGLEKTQGISRPWIYSYFSLLQLLGLTPSQAETTI